MCGHGLIGLAQAHRSTSTPITSRGSAARAGTLVAHLGREIKAEAEVVRQVTGEHRAPRTPSGEAA
jgi:hypothetical protein